MEQKPTSSDKPPGGVHVEADLRVDQAAPGAQVSLVRAQRIDNLHVHGLQVSFAGLDWQPEAPPENGALPEPGDLPPGSRLDWLRNEAFTGREKDLLALAGGVRFPRLGQGGGPAAGPLGVLAAAGMGGIGKTQLAVEFCFRWGRCFYGLHWLDARQPPAQEIAACGEKMALQPWPEKLPEQAALTERLWQAEGAAGLRHLAVLDNVEDEAQLRAWLPRLRGLQVLFTSRQADWPAELGVRAHRLDVLLRPESRALLRALARRLKQTPDEALDLLCARLGDLPLALHLAGRYLDEVGSLEVGGYLDELEKEGTLGHESQAEWLAHLPTGAAASLPAAFALSWKRLDEIKDALARRLFLAAGWCAAGAPIPEAVLAQAGQEGEQQIKASRLGRGLKRLLDLGLLEPAEGGVKIHPLLGEYARRLEADNAGLARLADALETLSYQALESGLPARLAPLRVHLQAAAAASEAAGLEAAGSLWNNLGSHLKELADFAAARAAFERALRIDERIYGPEHPKVAIRVNNLGSVLQDLGELPAARAALERALTIWRKVYGEEHPQVATGHNNLGLVLQALGELPAAREAYERALAIWRKVYGEEHPQVATGHNNLGSVLQALGELPAARAAYERALRIDERIYGPEHPAVARDVNNLGGVLRALGELPAARAVLERALGISRKVYGEEHPQVATGHNNLGLVLQDLGELPAARAAFERALRIDERIYGPEHPNVAIRVNNLGTVLQDLGELPAARAAYERALRIDERIYGLEHPQVATGHNNLGSVLQDLGELPAARAAYERALGIDERVFGPEHPKVAIRVNNLGSVLQALGELPAAGAAFERALRIFENFLPPEHPNIITVKKNLATLSSSNG